MSLTLNTLRNSPAVQQARTLFGNMNPKQRTIIGGGVLAVIVGIFLFVRTMGTPNYSLLYSSLQPADAQQVSAALASLGIPNQVSADGASVSVPADDLDRARLQLAARGLPHSGQLGFEIFDKANWSGSDFAEQVNYQRALEGELERTIETIHDVQSARVHITMAHDSLFTADDRPAKAAVLLSLRDGTLDPAMVTAIQHLVASSVDHLSPQNVAIMDANGDLSMAGATGPQAEGRLEAALSDKIIATLAPIVGAQHVRASVSVAYDPTSSDDTQETYDPAGTAVLSSQRTSVGGGGGPVAAGVPGTTSNLPKAQAPGTSFSAQLGAGGGSPTQQSDSETFAVSRSVNHVIRPADTLQRLSAAVVVDDVVTTVDQKGRQVTVRQPRSAAELQQMQNLVAAAIGLNPARGDVLTVTNLPFLSDQSSPGFAAPASPVSNPEDWLKKLTPVERWSAIGGVAMVLLLLFGLLGWGMMHRRHVPAVEQQTQLPAPAAAPPPQPANPGIDMLNITELLTADPDVTPPEVRQVLQLKDRLAERVKREPAIASRLIQVWMNRQREEQI